MQHRSGPRKITGRYNLVDTMRMHKPSIVVAYDQEGGEIAKINVLDVRHKWARVIESLEGLDWAKCALQDKKGGHLAVHMRTADDRDPATELETLMPSKSTAEVSAMVSIMLRAQEMVLIRHERSQQPLLDAHVRMLDAAMRRLDLLERQYEHAMSLNHQLSQDLVAAQLSITAGDDAPLDEEGKSKSQHAADAAAAVFIPKIINSMMTPNETKADKPNGAKDPKAKRPAPPAPTEPPTS